MKASGGLLLALALLAALALLPTGSAGAQDPSTYPDGISQVSHTPIEDGADFSVFASVDGAVERVTVTVCRFTSVSADGPEVCYMNLAASAGAEGWTASTAAGPHPAWRDGWVIGYKVTVQTSTGELHAPDRLAGNGEPDYYRHVVGEPEVEGSAVVEDTPMQAEPAAPAASASKDASLAAVVPALALAAAVSLARRR